MALPASRVSEWYQLAADQGDAGAQTALGVIYANGLGLQKDPEKGLEWFRKAADQGYANAQNNLGTMYDRGDGVEQNYAEAIKWYRLAADQGYANAQSTKVVSARCGSRLRSGSVQSCICLSGLPTPTVREFRRILYRHTSGSNCRLRAVIKMLSRPDRLLRDAGNERNNKIQYIRHEILLPKLASA